MRSIGRFFNIYYLLLLIVLISRQSDAEPSMALRLAFITAVVAPTIISKKISFPAIISMFMTLTLYGFSYSYMPYMTYIYAILTLVFTFFFLQRQKAKFFVPSFLFLVTGYVFLIDLIANMGGGGMQYIENVFYCFLMLVCFYFVSNSDSGDALRQISLSLIVVTIVFSVLFIQNRETFAVYYDYNEEFERFNWTDPNYFGTVIGMGSVMAMMLLYNAKKSESNLMEKVILIFSIAISVPVLFLNASRGAVLSVAAAGVVLILFTKMKIGYKLLIIGAVFAALVILYNNQYMDLLAYRIENEDTGGSGRTSIWISKLQAYSNSGMIAILFGCGYEKGLSIGGHSIGFHNDFVAFLVDYGLVGLVLFLYMLYYPIKKVPRNSYYFPFVVCIITYLVVTGMTLEPLTGGRLPYFVFYLQALLMVNVARYDVRLQQTT